MRPEIKEYNFDWLIWRSLDPASKLSNGSAKELEQVYRYVPYFKGVLKGILDTGRVGASFLKMLNQYFEDLMTAREKGKKIAMITFSFSPTILQAMDVVPVTMELLSAFSGMMWKRGAYDYLDHAVQVGLTETACSAQRGAMGAYLSGLGEEVDFIICNMPGSCDTNATAFAFAAAYLDKPFMQLCYPATLGDDRSERYHVEDFKEVISFVEDQTGKILDEDRLRCILEEVKKQDEMVAELEDMMRLKPSPVPGIFNIFNYGGRFLCHGRKEYTDVLADMLEAARENLTSGHSGLSSGEEKLRALLCYIDHYTLDVNFFNWLDRRGISHMGNVLSRHFPKHICYSEGLSPFDVDTTDLDTMLESIAQMNARAPMPRMVRGPYDGPNQWLDESLGLAKMFSVDCLIYAGTPGCRNTWGMIKPFARDIEKQGYPVHIMYSDAFDDRMESWENTSERLDEFFTIRGLLRM